MTGCLTWLGRLAVFSEKMPSLVKSANVRYAADEDAAYKTISVSTSGKPGTDILELSYSWCVRWTENPEEVVRFHWAPQVTCSSGLRARSAKPRFRRFESDRDLRL